MLPLLGGACAPPSVTAPVVFPRLKLSPDITNSAGTPVCTMTGEEDASYGTTRRTERDERPRDDDHPRPTRAAERGGPADGRGAARRVPRLRARPRGARRRALGRPRHLLRGLRSQGLRGGATEAPPPVRRGADGPDAHAARPAGDRRRVGLRRRGRPRAGSVVRPPRGRGGRDHGRLQTPLGRAADRPRHGATAGGRRPPPRAPSEP